MQDNKMRFAKLMSALRGKRVMSNPGIDQDPEIDEENQVQLQLIDDKISQLEESDDPKALESINFWKQRRLQLARN